MRRTYGLAAVVAALAVLAAVRLGAQQDWSPPSREMPQMPPKSELGGGWRASLAAWFRGADEGMDGIRAQGEGGGARPQLVRFMGGARPVAEWTDRNGDGRADLVAEYKDGQLARVRRDTNFDGAPDVWSFYRGGQLVREEEDPDGDGFRNRVALYENGRLVSEREDRDGDGRVDRVTYYDAEERVARRDEDQDGDGLVDARAFYEAGRLVRRELVSETQGGAIDDEEDLSSAAWSVDGGGATP